MKQKIKLKDLTLSQYYSYKQDICESSFCKTHQCPFDKTNCCTEDEDCWLFNKDLYSDKLLDREIEIEVPTFTDKEKTYLHNLLKPFKERIIEIGLHGDRYDTVRYLQIIIKAMIEGSALDSIILPCFDTEIKTMYTGLELNKKYKDDELKELLRELEL